MPSYTDDAIVTFLEAQVTRLEALNDAAGDNLLSKAWVSPGTTASKLLADAVFPVALVNDEGGSPLPHNNSIEQRRFSVTVICLNETDLVGENAEKDLLNICGVVRRGDGTNPGLELDTGNANVSWGGDGPLQTVVTDQGVVLYSKTIEFSYELVR
jgi:hypothetical protein